MLIQPHLKFCLGEISSPLFFGSHSLFEEHLFVFILGCWSEFGRFLVFIFIFTRSAFGVQMTGLE